MRRGIRYKLNVRREIEPYVFDNDAGVARLEDEVYFCEKCGTPITGMNYCQLLCVPCVEEFHPETIPIFNEGVKGACV